MSTTNQSKRGRLAKGTLDVVVVILAILCLISAALLAIRLNNFIKLDNSEVWLTTNMDQQLDLFSVSYENETGEVTVFSAEGERLVAPGTAVDYTIHLRNTEETAINYKLQPDIQETSQYAIPIVVRMYGQEGYIIGGENEWIPIGSVNTQPLYDTLKTNESAEYIFQWKWEFESGNDDYDTQLGTDAEVAGIGVSVSFDLHTEANTSIEENGGWIRSERGGVYSMSILLLVLAIVLAIVLIVKNRKKKK